MKISFIAAIIESVYNNGRISSDTTLDRRDFEQYSLASAGAIIRTTYYDEKRAGSVSDFIATMIEFKPFDVTVGKRGMKSVDAAIFAIPAGLGLFNIYPVDECEDSEIDYKLAFMRIPVGSEKLYNKDFLEDIGQNAFTLKGGKPVLYCQDEVKKVMVEGVFRGEDMDVPEYVARLIINDVLGETLKMKGFPLDWNDNGNPNVKAINSKLADAA